MSFSAPRSPRGLTFAEQLRFGWSDLRQRKLTVFVAVASIAVATTYLVVPGYFGARLYQQQQTAYQRTLPTRIVATVGDTTNLDQRFTEARLEATRQVPGIQRAVPLIECNLHVRIGETDALVAVRSTEADDPATTGNRLEAGKGVSSLDAAEAVVSHDLFRRLGGTIDAHGRLHPEQLLVEARRTKDGQPERHQLTLAIVGVVTPAISSGDRLFMPARLLSDVDEWCTHRSDQISLGGRAAGIHSRYPAAIAFVDKRHVGRIAAESDELEIDVEIGDELTVVSGVDTLTAAVRVKSEPEEPTAPNENRQAAVQKSPRLDDLPWPATRRHEFDLQSADGDVRILVVNRAEELGESVARIGLNDRDEVVCRSQEIARRIMAEWPHARCRVVRELPQGDWQAVCRDETLKWLTFVPANSTAIVEHSVVTTTNLEVARQLTRKYSLRTKSWPRVVACYEYRAVPNGARETQMRGAPAAAPSSGGRPWVDAVRATMKSNVACYELHSPLAASARLPDGSVRFIADELLRTLANDAGSRGAEVPHCLCTEAARTGGWLERLGFGPLRPIAGFVLPSDEREVWLPMSLLNRDVNAARPCGFVLFGDWLDLPNVDGMPGSGDSRPVLLFDSAPKNIVLRVPRSIEQLRREVGALADQCKLQGLPVVRGRLGRTDVNSHVFCSLRSESSSGERTAWMSSRPSSLTLKPNGDPGTVGLGADSTNQRLVRFQLDEQLPDDTVSVDASTWRDLTFDASTSHAMPAGALPFHLMRIPAVQWPQAQRALAERGFDVALDQPIVETRLQRVRVTARDRKEDAADDELVSCVSQAHPTFVFALPELSLDGHAANRKVRFHASTPLDPTRFQAPPVAGSWLNGDSRSIVLPASMAEVLFPRQTPRQSLGQAVRIGFAPLQPLGPADLLELEFTVVGWTDSNDGFLSLDTAKTLDLWRRGRLHYDADEEAFVTLRARSARLGALRSAIDVEDVDQIEGVVRWLEEQGWRTENSLSARAGLWRLLQVLVGAVVLFSLGCWLLSILLVGATAMINVSAKVWEIGVLKALGMTNGAIARVYWLQGIMLGCVGFLVGSVAAVVLERVTSKVLHSMFGLSGSLDGDRLASPQWAWLFATAFVACLFASSLAMWLPARRSASLDPVEAMRHRS